MVDAFFTLLPSTPSHLNSLCISSGWLVAGPAPSCSMHSRQKERSSSFPIAYCDKFTKVSRLLVLFKLIVKSMLSETGGTRIGFVHADIPMLVYFFVVFATTTNRRRCLRVKFVHSIALSDLCKHFYHTCLLRVLCIHTGLCLQMSTHANLTTT